ncbi:type II toxin-antitoxin system VapC family toxin [Mycetohabitans sp. B8]|uniref:type II toxin-antitoxin system VapC family toxin n=1 Tax=Mycetohabitans sp. B8 TaxID=2841845 RepID=UPI001F267766|nr:type II toxin-antitoxin system VapC family toxin [Mycetohabitans sp. B8]MCG1042914.1 type II toxin-antitoxin system VapC family toxin [Mycetohabitans sp. B8]
MKVLLDTHLILWAAADAPELPAAARALLDDPACTPLFSVASLWEIVVKRGLARADFQVEPRVLRRSLLDVGYEELPLVTAHALELEHLPLIHRDPFDRILIAQAVAEGIPLVTHDATIAKYPSPIRLV